MIYLVWLQTVAPALATWPVTITGWFALFLSAAGLVSVIYGYAKGIAKLNGYGERLKRQEGKVDRLSAQATEFERQVERVTVAQGQLLREIAATQKSAEGCNIQVQDFAVMIGSKIDELRRALEHEARGAGERLVKVETKIDGLTSGDQQPERRNRPPRGQDR